MAHAEKAVPGSGLLFVHDLTKGGPPPFVAG
jgi:hypothetical protein